MRDWEVIEIIHLLLQLILWVERSRVKIIWKTFSCVLTITCFGAAGTFYILLVIGARAKYISDSNRIVTSILYFFHMSILHPTCIFFISCNYLCHICHLFSNLSLSFLSLHRIFYLFIKISCSQVTTIWDSY